MSDQVLYIVIAAAVVLIAVAVVITWLVMRAHEVKACNSLENRLLVSETELKTARELREADALAHERPRKRSRKPSSSSWRP